MILRLRHGAFLALAALPLGAAQLVVLAGSIFLHGEEPRHSGSADRHAHVLIAEAAAAPAAAAVHVCPGCVLERSVALAATGDVRSILGASRLERARTGRRRAPRSLPRSTPTRAPPRS